MSQRVCDVIATMTLARKAVYAMSRNSAYPWWNYSCQCPMCAWACVVCGKIRAKIFKKIFKKFFAQCHALFVVSLAWIVRKLDANYAQLLRDNACHCVSLRTTVRKCLIVVRIQSIFAVSLASIVRKLDASYAQLLRDNACHCVSLRTTVRKCLIVVRIQSLCTSLRIDYA